MTAEVTRREVLREIAGYESRPDVHITPSLLRKYLVDMSLMLDDLTKDLVAADVKWVHAEEDRVQARARAFLRAEGTVKDRDATADLETIDERVAAEAAQQIVRGIKAQIESLRKRITVGQSLGATLRSEISLGGYGGAA